ncbi:Rossmann-like and DUF2520 domain-containing protein [Papillibacter cinnamivorans]|uniref:Predicted oxidoreductase, contains short-chain dehydrogenase (SDR) and DUF2520 domains n=1 Tax=Papillibacter cinnamivorans DSM 12816 TaxID=1122930 RepID=A0A1W2A6E3_9FIRM|nr:Rossmann-like and DUF2520 domain-containing protein [Papillibacter cinnamivorans]SMC56206.1 Predicted oxidoreductase, contains short-chain dehydrogenase (SDR) and DUF2520 domains [Papillibacter cinnamivorans DSM 12816]
MKTIRISFIGAGKVGFSFGKYLKKHGLEIAGYLSRNPDSSRAAAEFVSTEVFLDYPSLIRESDMILITTPDSSVRPVYEELTRYPLEGRIVAHMSGGMSADVFKPTNLFGVEPISIHPICPISDKYQSYRNLETCYFSLEGSDAAYKRVMEEVFSRLPNRTTRLTGENKALYHLANVTVSNLYLPLMAKAARYLASCGFEEGDAIRALSPLMEANIRNVLEKGILGALTGPVERGDCATVKRHLSVIPPSDEAIYRELSRSLVSLAEEKHEERDYRELKDLLR